jgi:hypothetical protein
VSDWLRRRSGEGRHLILESSTHGSLSLHEVEEWLKEAAAQVVPSLPPSPPAARVPAPSLPQSHTPSRPTRSASAAPAAS